MCIFPKSLWEHSLQREAKSHTVYVDNFLLPFNLHFLLKDMKKSISSC